MSQSYEAWFHGAFGTIVGAPGAVISTSLPCGDKWAERAHAALCAVELEYVKELLAELRDNDVPGHLAEFGVFEGNWINHLWKITEELGMNRKVYGFDSFEGLSDPHPEYDSSFWERGQYACGLERVRQNVRASERTRIHLVKGWFADSLPGPEAQEIGEICFARIDCDIYEPALECLRYLGPRLSDGAILVFDDWPHLKGYGEQRAFEEWLPDVPNLKFEFLFYNTHHLYLRVKRHLL